MASRSSKQNLKVGVVAWLAAGSLLVAPSSITDAIRVSVYDAVRPGQVTLRTLHDWGQRRLRSHLDFPDRTRQLVRQLEVAKTRQRQYELANAGLRQRLDEIERIGTSPIRPIALEPLIVPELIKARVLGRQTAELWRAGKLIDRGQSVGIRESSLVLDAAGMLIDQGKDAQLMVEQPVFAGRSVVGRIGQVGHWSSTVQLVTDPEFRIPATLTRKTPRGLIFAAEGQLQGQGTELCRLTLVNSSEPVQVGNEIYTASRSGTMTEPMYLGRVVKARVKPNSIHWDIWVKPAVAGIELRTVQVLRKSLNPLRMLGQ